MPDVILNKTFIPKSKQQDEPFNFLAFFSIVFERLTPMHQIRRVYKDNRADLSPLIRKGKYQPVEFKLESRGGNKKVTRSKKNKQSCRKSLTSCTQGQHIFILNYLEY